MLSTDRRVLNVHEPEVALAWVDAFKSRCIAGKKTDVESNGGKPADFQATDQFLYFCGVEILRKMKSLVAMPEEETMPFTDIETVSKNYPQHRKRLLIAEQTNLVAITQLSGESSGDFLARFREAAKFSAVGKLKNVANPETYMIQLRCIAGLQNSERKKNLECRQSKPEATFDDIILVIQQRNHTVQSVNKQKFPNENVFFDRNVSRRKNRLAW